jgi:hypothetical protein
VAAGLLAALQGCAVPPAPQEMSDWERQREAAEWREIDVAPPAYPKRENLLPFFVSSATTFEFYIDGTTLSLGEDRVVRYVLVARSAQGAQSVSFEGMRCSTGEVRVYAVGTSEGGWTRSKSPWRQITPREVQRWHNALFNEFFCPLGTAIHSAEEGVAALKRGDHPSRAPTGN